MADFRRRQVCTFTPSPSLDESTQRDISTWHKRRHYYLGLTHLYLALTHDCKTILEYAMSLKFRTLIIWLILLALPVQGFAAAFMPFCELVVAPVHSADQVNSVDQAASHTHNTALMGEHHDHSEHHAISHHGGGSCHGDAKCGVCAACCVGAAMLSSDNVKLHFQDSVAPRLSFAFKFPVSIVLATPERPPQILFV